MTAHDLPRNEFVPIVTYTPTLQDGPVIRWYRNPVHLDQRMVALSASRNSVVVSTEARTDSEISALNVSLFVASDVQQRILNGEDVRHLATHARRGLFGPYEEIQP